MLGLASVASPATGNVGCGAAIGACGRQRRWAAASDLLEGLRQAAFVPGQVAYNTVVSACASSQLWALAATLLRKMQSERVEQDVISCNAACTAYDKTCRWEGALLLVSGVPGRGLEATTVKMNTLITACAKGSCWPWASQLLRGLHQRLLNPSVMTFSASASACTQGMQWERALRLLSDLQDAAEANAIVCSVVAKACEMSEQWELAVAVTSSMRTQSLLASADTEGILVAAPGCLQDWSRAVASLAEAHRRLLQPSLVICNAVATACEKSQRWTSALGALDDVRLSGLETDDITYSVALSACDDERREPVSLGFVAYSAWRRTSHLLGEMRQNGFLTGGLSVGVGIGAAKRASLWWQALSILDGARVDWVGNDEGHGLPIPRRPRPARVAASVFSLRSSSRVSPSEIQDSSSCVLADGCGVVATAKAAGDSTGLALERLLTRLRTANKASCISPVSRLDLHTSGVLVAALGGHGSAAANSLLAQFAGRLVTKEYLCLSAGWGLLGGRGAVGEMKTRLKMEEEGCVGRRAVVSATGRVAHTQCQSLLSYSSSLVFQGPASKRT